MPVRQRSVRLEHLQPSQTLGSVELARPRRFAAQGDPRTREHMHVLASRDLADDAGVATGPGHRNIAAHGHDGLDVELGRGEGQQKPDGVVDPGVAVDDQALASHPA